MPGSSPGMTVREWEWREPGETQAVLRRHRTRGRYTSRIVLRRTPMPSTSASTTSPFFRYCGGSIA
jgi:hypothetical protein